MSSCGLSYFSTAKKTFGKGRRLPPPPSNYSTLLTNPRILCLKVAVIAPHMQTIQSSEKSLVGLGPVANPIKKFY